MPATLALRRSTSCSAYQPAGLTYQPSRSSSDRRYVLDSGGRPNGTPGSRLTITTRPAKPSSPQGRGGVAPRDAAADDHDRAPADSVRHGVHPAVLLAGGIS